MYAQLISFTANNDEHGGLYNAIKTIKLNEKHEVGEIINDYWLVLNEPEIIVEDEPYEPKYFYEKGDYIRVADIRLYTQFSTDKKFDNREDMRWLQTECLMSHNKIIVVHGYEYIG